MTTSTADVLDRLRDLIEADGRKDKEIAAAAKMAPTALHRFRYGLRANPSIATVNAIRVALGKTWGDLDSE